MPSQNSSFNLTFCNGLLKRLRFKFIAAQAGGFLNKCFVKGLQLFGYNLWLIVLQVMRVSLGCAICFFRANLLDRSI
jgi:hypothetical protein